MTTAEQLKQYWNYDCAFTKVRVFTVARLAHLRNRMNDKDFQANWKAAIDRITHSDFCKGKNDRCWKATIDWFLRPDTVNSIMEGKYDNPPTKDYTEHGISRREPETELERRSRTITPEQWLAFNTYLQGLEPSEIETLIDDALASMSESERRSAGSFRDVVCNSMLHTAAFGVWEQRNK